MSVLILAFKCIILEMKEECFDCIIKVVAEMQSKFIAEIYCTKNWRPPSPIKAPEDISLSRIKNRDKIRFKPNLLKKKWRLVL